MDKRKNKIKKAFLAILPVLAFLACGTVKEATSIKGLAEGQEEILLLSHTGTEAENVEAAVEESGSTAFVHICGEIVSPGVYEVPYGSRICDVLLLAGGFTQDAAPDAVNLAAVVSDGMQVFIPSFTEAENSLQQEKREREGLVNINTASAEELCNLPGIGESRAADIIAYREEQGGFSCIEDIMLVSGIKEGMFKKLKNMIYVE